MAQDWDIKPRARVCTGCEQHFADGAICWSTLFFGDGGYQRGDFCAPCWDGKEAELTPFSTWQGVFRLPPPPPEEPLKKENAEALLRRLMEQEDDANLNVIYILTVMLERKKVFVEKDVKTTEDGSLLRIYEHRKSGETFLIVDPHLQLDELETVQQQVADMLGGGPEGRAQTPDAAARSADADAQPAAPDQGASDAQPLPESLTDSGFTA